MDFETMVRRGLGRAVLYARENDVSLHRDFLIHACLNNIAYDPAFAGDQSAFMADILQATGEAENYQHELLNALAMPNEDNDSQVYDILARIAVQGDNTVRLVLDSYLREVLEAGDYRQAEPLVNFAGLSGLLTILEYLEGKEIAEDDWWDIDGLFKALETKIGKEQAKSALEEAIAARPSYARYAEMIRVKRIPQKTMPYKPAVPSYEEITQTIATATPETSLFKIGQWSSYADEATVLKIASDLLQETDETRLACYLKFFQDRAFPLSPDRLLELAEHEDEELTWLARWALSHVTHPAVRELALRIFQNPEEAGQAVALLARNFQDGDWNIVRQAILREQTDEDRHHLGLEVRELFEEHPDPESKDTLLAFYENGPCMLCRHSIIEDLQMLGSLPHWMLEECRYDAYDSTREFVAALSSTKPPISQ